MAIIPQFFFDAVVAIGIPSSNEETEWIGTGFLVGKRFVDGWDSIFLISNYHIFENKQKIIVRFNKEGMPLFSDYEIRLLSNGEECFSRHPSADIAAVQISSKVLEQDNSSFDWFSLDEHALTLNGMQNTDVTEGTIVYSLGFPMNLVSVYRKSPICRIGCISRITDLFFNGCKEDANEYLIDLQAVPGNSGAPVINRPEIGHITGTTHNNSANLIGIICGSIDYTRNSHISECPINDFEINSGIAVVHPVDLILEVVNMEYKRCKE